MRYVIFFGWMFVASAYASTPLSRPCAVPAEPSPRIFSDSSGHWREYKSKKEIPPDPDSEEDIESFGTAVIDYHFANQDWSSETISCYDANGTLQSVNFEVRTGWGWGYREQRAIERGILIVVAKSYFSINQGEQIPTPSTDLPRARRPEIFPRLANTPIYGFLRPRR